MSVLEDQASRERRTAKTRLAYRWPVAQGRLTTAQGERSNPAPGYHPGVDIGAPKGAHVCAAARGIVSVVRRSHDGTVYGRRVFIDHPDGCQTRYSHLDEIRVEAHQSVADGEVIGTVGNTGMSTAPHLDYEIVDHQTTEQNSRKVGYHSFIDPIRHHGGLSEGMGLGPGVGKYKGHVYNLTEIELREAGTYNDQRHGPRREIG